MNKKILAALLGLMLCFGIIGCGGNIESKANDVGNDSITKYFNLVTVCEEDLYSLGMVAGSEKIVYDKNTNVMYYIYDYSYQWGITPIYNSDGTVKLYEKK